MTKDVQVDPVDEALTYARSLADFGEQGYSPNEKRIMALAVEVIRLRDPAAGNQSQGEDRC